MKAHFLLLFLFFGFSWSHRTILENPRSNVQGWNRGEALPGNIPLRLWIAIKQQNLEQLEELFWKISNPKDPMYGKYLSKEEVEKMIAPHPSSLQVIEQWLQSFEIQQKDYMNDFISIELNASEAEKMLNCSFHRHHHPKSKRPLARCTSAYSVPSDVAQHIDFIGGVQHFPRVIERHSMPTNRDGKKTIREEPGLGVTPRIIRDRYAVGSTLGKSSKNRQAVAQFLEQYYSPGDLEEFFIVFFWEGIGRTADVDGPNYWYDPGVEASLDIQYIMSTGAHIPTTFYSTPGRHENQEPFLEWAIHVDQTADDKVPKVISVSYGDDEDSISLVYANRVNTEFQKMGIRGISILFASGDSGVGCNSQGNRFVPSFPAASPFVTAVGGTTTEGLFDLGPEIVNSLSGGGFSNYFAAPSYQKKMVSNYLSSARNLPNPSFYNNTGRAYPDVSALSAGYVVVVDLIPFPGVAGTSCASPVFSGVMALLNDLRLQNNKTTLGFLNPWLYQAAEEHPEVFFDVTEGCNPSFCPNDGFCAQKGWDPSSGLGTPLYEKMAKIILNY